jgi:hypothetical protein
MHRAEYSDNENLRYQADVVLLSYGFSKPPQLRDITSTSDINVTKKIAMSFVVSDLAPPGSYIEVEAEEEEEDG